MSMENSILRNIKNISRLLLYVICIATFALGVMTVFQLLMDGYGTFDYIKENLQFYFFYMCTFCIFVFNVRLSTTDAAIILSFCSRRRDYLTAKYVVNAVIIMVLLGIKLLMDIYRGGYKLNNMVWMAILMVTVFGVVNILGIIIIRYGRIGYIIFVFTCMTAGGITAALLLSVEKNILSKLNGARGIILMAAVVFMIISMVTESRIVMKSDIKR